MKKASTLLIICFITSQLLAQNILWENSFQPQLDINAIDHSQFKAYEIGTFQNTTVQTRTVVPQELADTLQAILDLQREMLGAKGLSAAVNLENGDIWAGASGLSSSTDSIAPEMALGIGSISKTLTAAAILQLYDEGLLNLEDSLGQWLDTYDNINPAITIRQLLNHTGGIFNYTNNPDIWAAVNNDLSHIWTPEEILTGGYVLEPDFIPGTGWNYSNTGYILLGMIIESASNQSYAEVIRQRFIEPYALETTALYPDETDLVGPLAHLWFDILGNGTATDAMDFGLPLEGLFSVAWSAGAYTSTPSQLTQWAKILYAGDLFEPATFDQMIEIVPIGLNVGYGLGVIELPINNEMAWGHGGDLIYSSQMYYFPDKGISLAIQCNDGTIAQGSNSLYAAIEQILQTVCEFTPPVNTKQLATGDFDLQITPNPFNENLNIEYILQRTDDVNLRVYDINGQLIHTQNQLKQPKGEHQISLNELTNKITSGIYICKIATSNQIATRRIIKQ